MFICEFRHVIRLNSLGRPLGIETILLADGTNGQLKANWPGTPVGDWNKGIFMQVSPLPIGG